MELFPLVFNFHLFFLTRHFQAAAANELNDLAQFVAVEPGAVALANVHDHA